LASSVLPVTSALLHDWAMPGTNTAEAEYWRALARETRIRAADTRDEASKMMLLGIAHAYDDLANRTERLAGSETGEGRD
jgi:hypothetical protein